MSLTSYRAAPPRASVGLDRRRSRRRGATKANAASQPSERRAWPCGGHPKEALVLGRPGNDLLSRVLRHSTIGAEEFNGRVRDGIGFLSPRSDHRTGQEQQQGRLWRRPEPFTVQAQRSFSSIMITNMNHESNQANRAISTSQLNASPRLHIWPINVVVFHGSDREHSFRGRFPA